MRLSKKVAAVSNECVACGSCEKVCPWEPYPYSEVYMPLWIGINHWLRKCQKICPASVISIIDREEQNEKKEILV